MDIEEFLENLSISFSEEDQNPDSNHDSIGHLAKKRILEDKNTIFNIIEILANNQNFPSNIVFLTKIILSLLIQKIDFTIYNFDELDHFSEAFFNFITKFEEDASIFSIGITTIAKVLDYKSDYIMPLEQHAFDKLAMTDGNQYDYEFAITTLSNLVQLYHYKGNENMNMEFYDRIKEATLPFINTEFTNYWIPSNITSIYKSYDYFSFDIFYQDPIALDAFLNILINASELLITDSIYDYFKNILKFFNLFFIHCRDNSDNTTLRREINIAYLPKVLQVLPEFLLYLIDFSENNPNTHFLAGMCFSFIIVNFEAFKQLEIYDSIFDSLMQSFIFFSQLNEDDLSDFRDNIFNYYNTAIAIEEKCSSNARSNSVILLHLICDNENQSYINHAIDILLQMDQSEEIFFLLSHIIELINYEEVIDAVHQYITATSEIIEQYPTYVQLSFILLASSSIYMLTDEESEQLLDIASNYIGEIQQEEMTPINQFYFTIAIEISFNFINKYNILPEIIMEPIIKLYICSYSTNTPRLIDLIFEIYPQYYEKYQNGIIEAAIEVVECYLTSNSEFSLSSREEEFVMQNLETIILQSQNPNPNFPTTEIVEKLIACAKFDLYQEYLPLISDLLAKIIETKANNYEQVVELSANFFTDTNLLNYNAETVKPILLLVNDLDFEMNIKFIEITIENISNHINSFFTITDDDTLKDFIACSTLLSRLVQSLGDSIPQNVYDEIAQLTNNIREIRDDLPMLFIVYEILASLTLHSHGVDMIDEVDDWIVFCSLGIIKTNYYRKLHILALSLIAESFPDLSTEISPILDGLENDTIDSNNKEAELFLNKFDFFFDYAKYLNPFQ